MLKKISFFSWFVSIFAFFLYSFTQVDLGLTLIRLSSFQAFQKFFQNIGYLNRPLSTIFFVVITTVLFILYAIFLYLAHKRKIKLKELWILILGTSAILLFSYNAFSYDLFNYIFDAKIITFYHQNPYIHKALDYPGDPMLGFMHWTHRTFPYGPIWLALTVPLSFISLNLFLPTLILFKALSVAAFLGTAFFLGKIIKKIKPESEILTLAAFGLNPFIILESIISSHNDIIMMFFSVVAVYVLVSKKYFRSFLLLLLSIGVKFATIFLLPIFIIVYIFEKRKKSLNWDKVFLFVILLMLVAVVLASYRTTYQQWYLLFVFPFAVLLINKYFILIPLFIISLFSVLEYAPFLYSGNWNSPVPVIIFWFILLSVALSLIGVFLKPILLKK